MWIKTDEDVTTFMERVKAAYKNPDSKIDHVSLLQRATLALVEHELRHAIRESGPGMPKTE